MLSFQELEYIDNSEALKEQLAFWLSLPIYQGWKDEVLLLLKEKNIPEIKQRFSSSLGFGTAGVRATMGLGLNRLNEFTIAKITLGLIHFLKSQKQNSSSIVTVGYDSRNHSFEFAKIVVQVFLSAGFKPILFSTPVPSPVLAYATQHYGACVGVMITASHNPKEYNGYKIYNEHGGQFISSETKQIFHFIESIKQVPLDKIIQNDIQNISSPEDKFFETFFSTVKKSIPFTSIKNDISLVYSPLFGAGKWFGEKMIDSLGGKLILVEEQNQYNGDFPGCEAPNPEKHENFELSIKYANQFNAPLCVLTDPDADRIGLWENGYFFNGNEIGTLLGYFILENNKNNQYKKIVSSVVSTQMTEHIANYWGASYEKTLTGFKYIGDIVQKNPDNFLFGFEESYGFLIGPYVQDKDAIGALGIIHTMANILYAQGKTFYSFLKEIYEKIGFSCTQTIEITLSKSKMESILENIMSVTDVLFGYKIVENLDFSSQEYFVEGKKIQTKYFEGLDSIALKIFKLEEFLTIAIRPSGTEPKLKIYVELFISADKKVDKTQRMHYLKEFKNLLKQIENLVVF